MYPSQSFKRIIFVSILLCLFTAASAEETEISVGEITGVIIDVKSREPIPYASVALLNAVDSALITGVITDEQGGFIFEKVPFGVYKIRVSYLGYKQKVLDNIEVSKKSKKINLEKVALAENLTELEEVSVVQERIKGEEEIDRTVFTLNDDVRKSASTGLDVLKHIPSVTVDFQENVTLEGQTNIQFYVDGVLRNKEFVAQLTPERIDKVELITNPGVKYSSEVSGVINIVLKKEYRAGVSGSIRIPAALPDKMLANPRASFEYGTENMRFYIGDRLHFERFKGSEILTTQTDDNFEVPYYFNRTGSGFKSWLNNYTNYGIDWFVSDKTSINLLGEWTRHRGVTEGYQNDSRTYHGDVLSEYFTTRQNSYESRDNHFFSAFMKHSPNEGSELTIELNYYLQGGKTENEFRDSYYDPVNFNTIVNRVERDNITENLRNTAELKSDFNFTTGELKHEMGIRASQVWMENDFIDAYTLESITGEENRRFRYNEFREALYYSATGKLKKLNWQLGLRGEFDQVNVGDTTNFQFFSVLPQVNISRNFEKQQVLKFSFRRQVSRPDFNDLNPFETWSDSLHLRVGNPDLKPAVENRMELVYSKNFKSNYISPKLYLRFTNNGIQDLTKVNPDGVTVISRENIGENLEYGLGFNSALQITKFLRLNSFANVFERRIKTTQNQSLANDNHKWSYRVGGSVIVTLPKEFTWFTFANYNSPNISYQRTFYRDFLILTGVEKQFGENAKLSVMYNPFIKEFTYSRVVTRVPGYEENWAGRLEVHHLVVAEFTYSFNKGRKIKTIKREVEYEKDTQGGSF